LLSILIHQSQSQSQSNSVFGLCISRKRKESWTGRYPFFGGAGIGWSYSRRRRRNHRPRGRWERRMLPDRAGGLLRTGMAANYIRSSPSCFCFVPTYSLGCRPPLLLPTPTFACGFTLRTVAPLLRLHSLLRFVNFANSLSVSICLCYPHAHASESYSNNSRIYIFIPSASNTPVYILF